MFLPAGAPAAWRPADAATPAASAAGNSDAMLERMRKLVNDDPGVIGQVLRPQPVFAGGKMRGFRVYPGANRQAFARMGLRAGDLVTAINGTPLDDKDRAQEIFHPEFLDRRTGQRHAQWPPAGTGAQHCADRGRSRATGRGGDGMIPLSQPPDAEPPAGNE